MYKVFVINGICSEDVFESGEKEEHFEKDISISFEHSSCKGLLETIAAHFDISVKDMYKDDIRDNVINFSLYEDKEGSPATEGQMSYWRKGELRLWICDYSFTVYKCEEIDVHELFFK